MPAAKVFAQLFDPPPARWGLRGDPYLWQAMRAQFTDSAYPNTEEQLIDLFEQTYQRLSGVAFTHPEPFFVERYSYGGMSSGSISPTFWREQALPLLLARYRERVAEPA